MAEEPFQVGCRTAVQGDEVHAVDAGIDVDGQVGMEPGALGRTFGKLINVVVEGNVSMPGHPVGLGRGGVVHRVGKPASGMGQLLGEHWDGCVRDNSHGEHGVRALDDTMVIHPPSVLLALDDGEHHSVTEKLGSVVAGHAQRGI